MKANPLRRINSPISVFVALLTASTILLSFNAFAQPVSFGSSGLTGENLDSPTSLDFGPDNRLYVSIQNGTIYAYTIVRNGPNSYSVTNTEIILLVKSIPNHNDDGTLNTSENNRQITGILAAGTSSNPVLYVTSSDPRIGGGGTGGDKNLDTNSGVISKLTKNGRTWSKIDIVKGLPRSEENHANNGMALDPATNTLYVAVGGHTNAGAPSNNFAFITEYALSAAILKINLSQIETQFGGSYNLPTLDDPTRTNTSPGVDQYDPFGGNDGRNQAKLVSDGPVQIHAPGYRNSYDLVFTTTPEKSGRIYTVDNGANGGWGGHPANEGAFGNPLTTSVTNNYVTGEPGSTSSGPNDAKVNNLDNLHYVSGPGFGPIYGGHPNPIRANPQGAGLYWYNNSPSTAHFELNPTPDWPPVPLSMANPVEGDFRNPGVNDGALYTWPASTNGLAEYTASNFGGAMTSNLLTASFDGIIYRIQLNTSGTAVTSVTSLFSGFGSTPLDVIAQGDSEIFPGTIWAATYGSDNITIFEPQGATTCTGIDSNTLDDDQDGYSNADEIDNGTNPCSQASKPEDNDQDNISDLNDPDDDNDGLNDIVDNFALDAQNGLTTLLPLDYPFLNGNPGFGLFGVGFTGLMTNGVNNYRDQFDTDHPDLIVGGAVGVVSVPANSNDAVQNNQQYAFQFGVNISQATGPITIQSKLLGAPFFGGLGSQQLTTHSHGIYFGTGDQANYLKFALHGNQGNPGFQVLSEQNGIVAIQQMIPVSGILSAEEIELFINVNPATGAVTCFYKTSSNLNPVQIGGNFQVTGNLLTAIQSTSQAVAVGVIATSGNANSFSASWDYMKVAPTNSSAVLIDVIRINAGGPTVQFGSETWVSDQYFTGTQTYSSSTPIDNTTNDAVYQSERYGNTIAYAIPVPQSGQYLVELHLAELYWGVSNATGPGQRIFNINIENGQFIRSNLDIAAEYGVAKAVILKAQNINVTDGTININFTTVTNNAKVSGIALFRHGTVANGVPIVTTPPNKTLVEGAYWSYQVIASDPNSGDVLTYSASNLPASLTINSATGIISGTIEVSPGTYPVTITVADQAGASSNTSFVITITPAVINSPPVVTKPPNKTLNQGESWSYQVIASDPNSGDVLTYSASNLPASLSINSSTGLINGTATAAPGTFTVTLTVTDQAGASGSNTFVITVNPVSGLAITSLVLINSITDIELFNLTNGMVLYKNNLPVSFNIKANVASPAGSVKFAWQGNASYRTENTAPYALAGDSNGNYNNLTMATGSYSVTATPYPNSGAGGTAGQALSLSFTVLNGSGSATRKAGTNADEEMVTSPDVDESITLYPNPASSQFTVRVHVEEPSTWNFVIHDVVGREIPLGTFSLTEGVRSLEFDLTPKEMSPGLYYLNVSNSLNSKKIIKIAITR